MEYYGLGARGEHSQAGPGWRAGGRGAHSAGGRAGSREGLSQLLHGARLQVSSAHLLSPSSRDAGGVPFAVPGRVGPPAQARVQLLVRLCPSHLLGNTGILVAPGQ